MRLLEFWLEISLINNEFVFSKILLISSFKSVSIVTKLKVFSKCNEILIWLGHIWSIFHFLKCDAMLGSWDIFGVSHCEICSSNLFRECLWKSFWLMKISSCFRLTDFLVLGDDSRFYFLILSMRSKIKVSWFNITWVFLQILFRRYFVESCS